MSYDPRSEAAWASAVEQTPRRKPFSDVELAKLRVAYDPKHVSDNRSPYDMVVIWTLLDMLEKERGWRV